MPTYDYKCKECGRVFEVFRRFSDLGKEIKCPSCGTANKLRTRFGYKARRVANKDLSRLLTITQIVQRVRVEQSSILLPNHTK